MDENNPNIEVTMSERSSTIPDVNFDATEKEIDKTINFVKLHRSILEKKIWKDPILFRLFTFILLTVKWDDDFYTDGAINIPLKPGEMVGSLSYLMKGTGLTKTQTHFKLNQLRTSNTIQTEVKQGLTVITLINFSVYHAQKLNTKTDVERKLNADQTEVKPKSGISKELKKKRTKELKKKELRLIQRDTDESHKTAERWHAHAISHQPWLNLSVEKFIEGVTKLKKSVGLSDEQVGAVLDYVIKDAFWADKALSPASLLKRSSRSDQRKIDTILGQMKKPYDKMKKVEEWINTPSDKPFDPFGGVK